MLPRYLIHISLHQHLCKLEVLLHVFETSFESDVSVFIGVLDLVDLGLLFLNLFADFCVLVLLILDPPLYVVALFNQRLLMQQLLSVKSLHLLVHLFEGIFVFIFFFL